VSFSVRPATSFPDVSVVLGPKNSQATVCWCLSHRLDSKTNKALIGPQRGAYVENLTKQRVPPGVLAYDSAGSSAVAAEVVGWAAVAPRAALPFARSRKIPPLDELPVWSVWCLRVQPGRRGQGVAHALLEGAIDFAREHGAPASEGYPVDNNGRKVDSTMAYVGTRSLFEATGFALASETSAVAGGFPRVIMRRAL
jgi:GNAT superfamily N-acetyltransferase